MIEYEAQPVTALVQHAGEQLFDPTPPIVETVEEQLGISLLQLIGFRIDQRLPRGTQVEFVRPFGNDQGSPCPGGHRKLAREPEIERVDGLNSQTVGIFSEVPSAR